VCNEQYTRKVLPYLKLEYFSDPVNKELFNLVTAYVSKYNTTPSKEALLIDANNSNVNGETKAQLEETILNLSVDDKTSYDWLLDTTEDFCKKQAIQIALMKSIKIVSGEDKEFTDNAIPGILNEALSISFDQSIGHDYFDDAEKRYDYYHRTEIKVPFGIDILNKITKGGVSRKTLTILMGGVNVGKTMLMCSMAANNLKEGKNVLYISMEMSEEMIGQRIDAHLIDINMDDVTKLERQAYLNSINIIKSHTVGRLKTKEYPTSQAGSANFRYLLNDLKLKSNFVPDIIYIDYLNICSSSRLSKGRSNLYEYVLSISQELRGLAVEFDIPIITATQFNRAGFSSTDPGMEDTSESFGTNATADLILSVVRTQELDAINQLLITQLKTRYSDIREDRRFTLGIDIKKMKLYNIEDVENINNIRKSDFAKSMNTMNNDAFTNMFKDFQ